MLPSSWTRIIQSTLGAASTALENLNEQLQQTKERRGHDNRNCRVYNSVLDVERICARIIVRPLLDDGQTTSKENNYHRDSIETTLEEIIPAAAAA